MGHSSAGPKRTVMPAAIPKAESLECGGLRHAPCTSLHRFAIPDRRACGAGGNYGRSVPQAASVQVRVYDKDHNDYHNWDDNENRAWGVFLTQNHRKSHEFSTANKKEQSQYWNWRHSHPDGR
jgi:hypothetical protein